MRALPSRSRTAVRERFGAAAIVALLVGPWGSGSAEAQQPIQGFTVSPVSIEIGGGQRTAVLTVQNHSDREASFQVRPFAWAQPGGVDDLQPTDALLASPPLGVLPVGASQVVRLVLRQPAQGRENAYRIWLDQIPPPAAPGAVGFALRLSIPIFAEPPGRVAAQLRWVVEASGETLVLVAVNEGTRRAVVHDLELHAPGGGALALEANVSPYVLAGATRRWQVLAAASAPARGETLRLTAIADTGPIDKAVAVVRAGP